MLAVTLVTAKKVKSCGMRARVREGKTPTQFLFLTLFCQSRKEVLRLHPARPIKLPNLVFVIIL